MAMRWSMSLQVAILVWESLCSCLSVMYIFAQEIATSLDT
ncbi:hypothetical protein BVRB_2g041460 [Beta vulgaris subsp. vulgaris]|nr:hypothetical protein BVRB_2g041460 [Beta vulgaris subsp. vulgaris]